MEKFRLTVALIFIVQLTILLTGSFGFVDGMFCFIFEIDFFLLYCLCLPLHPT